MPVPPVIQMYRYVMGSGGGLGNLLKASEEFQQTVDWVRYPTSSQTPTVNADSRPDPNGGTTADQVGLTANTSARLQQTVTLSASTQYTFSVYARAVSGSVDFRMRNVTLKAAEVKTATTTGPDGGGFTRFTYTFTTTTAGSYELALQNDTNATAKDVIFWGAMLNQGGTALDYEYAAPTTGGSAPAPAYAGFGDAFGGVTAYYSLRQFTEAETLNAIRVRRSSDDTEQDIGFDANGDLDTTALTTFVNEDVNQYTSDFSSTEDLGEVNGTGAAAQSVGGVDDAYKFTLSGGSALHQSQKGTNSNGGDFSEEVGTLTFDYYLPSGQTMDEVFVGFTSGTAQGQTTTDAWTSVSMSITAFGGGVLFFRGRSGGSQTFSADGDVFYLKNIVVTQTTADGAVTTFYDQSGNGNNATNSTETQQPLIVDGGSVVTENSKAAIDFDGVDDKLGFASNLNIGGSPSIISVLNIAAGDVAWRGGGNDYWYFQGSQLLRYRNGDFDATWVNSDGLPVVTGSQKLIATYKNSTSVELAVDGTSIATKSSGTGTDGAFNHIGSDVLYMDGVWQELIIFTSDQSGNRTGIETNINDHFDIYTP